MQIRRARADDAEAIVAIYNHEVLTSTNVFDIEPRTLVEQRRWIEERAGAHAAIVAEEDGVVLGFASISAFRSRPAYATTVENSVYVATDARGRGVGRALLQRLIDLAAEHGFHSMIARVSSDNVGSEILHRNAKFTVVGVEREVGRKFGRWIDMTVMQRMLGDS